MAILSNAPVTCTDKGTEVLTFTAYTLTTSDGAHLTGMGSGTVVSGATDCTFALTLTATR
jgi:hypothetical protein